MAAELVSGAFLSAFLQVLFDRLASREFLDLFRGKEPIVKLLSELNITLNSAGLLLNDAEQKLIKDQRVKKWLDDLKDAVYDADDLVYKIDTEALQKKQEGESQSSFTSKFLKPKPTSFTAFDKAIKPEIEEVLGRLKFLLEQKNNLGLDNVKVKQLERLLAPLVEESDVYGRNEDKETIVKMLLSDDSGGKNPSVIPVVGMGGIGKTTLAQLVFKDERIDKKFETKVWVTVGEDKVDCLKVMKIIIEKVNSEKCETEEPYDLQDKAKKALSIKKFLFVIDDVWDEDPNKWDVLKGSFKSGLHGSKIIVTTRSTIVASIMKTEPIHFLKGVSSEDGWHLFAKHASIDVNSENYSDLQVIGKKIVDKCEGLPLALKSLGGLLFDKRDNEEWNKVLKSDIWELYARSSIGILPALWLSYYNLPSYLKPCFAYCAIFPKDYIYVKEKMILLWMAEGFLQPKNGKRMEEVGEEYFQDLISRSFLQPSSDDESALLMHDLMRDLAIFVSGEFCLEMDDPKFSNFASKIRHLSYTGKADDPKKLEGLSKAIGLRTFLTLQTERSLQVEHLLESLLCISSCLRVLSITNYSITKLPDSIGNLKYLKYLDLSDTKIEEIPDTVCNLCNLQTLLLKNCDLITRLPTNIGSLINLRHLHAPSSLEEMPLDIGKVKTLQTLNKFVVGKNSGSAGIKQLKELQDLQGTLEISGLENVVDVNDVLEAALNNKKLLITKLHLYWNWNGSHESNDSQKERAVLGTLQPYENLKELTIYRYQGTSFPNWVGDHLYSNLVKVVLFYCKNCWLLPPLGQLSSLKQLQISSFPKVVRVSSEFYYSSADSSVWKKPFRSLESLNISEMFSLEEWSFTEGEVEGGAFPCLKKLYLTGCPRLKVSLPGYLPSLRELKIDKCAQLLPLLPRAQPMDSAFPSLEIFIVSNCNGEDSLLTGGLPSNLKQIIILGCKNLTTLDEEAFQHLTSLEKLHIFSCDNLRHLPRVLTTCLSLKSLIIVEMSNLEECFFIEGEIEEGAFPRLEELHLKVCPRLEVSLPHNLPSLRRLEIEECSKLLPLFSRAQQMDSAFPSLEILTISGCDGQHSLLEGGLPSSLKQIGIYNCDNLTTLDEEAFQHLTSLGRLDIISCDSLQCLPRGLPTSLSTLNIRFCDLLTPRLQRETGEDWPIIENIPIKRIW